MAAQRAALLGLELKFAQTIEKAPVDFIGQRIQKNG